MAQTRAEVADRVSITSFADAESGVVQIGGELDFSNGERLADALDELESRGSTAITVMADELTFLDCAAARIIGTHAERMRSAGGRLAVTGTRRHIAAVLDLTGHHEVLGDENDAVHLTGAALVSFSLQGFVDGKPVSASWDGTELKCSAELLRSANLPGPSSSADRPIDDEDILCALVMLSWACDPVPRADVEFGQSS